MYSIYIYNYGQIAIYSADSRACLQTYNTRLLSAEFEPRKKYIFDMR